MPKYLEKQKETIKQLAAERKKQVKEDEISIIVHKSVALELLAIAVNMHADGTLTPKNLVEEYEKHINKSLKS